MSRLIDADVLLEKMSCHCDICKYHCRKPSHCSNCDWHEAMDDVDDMDEVEAEPVRHGHWVEYPECLKYDGAYMQEHIVCSKCETVWCMLDDSTERFEYCPACGAKMDEVTQ